MNKYSLKPDYSLPSLTGYTWAVWIGNRVLANYSSVQNALADVVDLNSILPLVWGGE
jgi:hypothetical protein